MKLSSFARITNNVAQMGYFPTGEEDCSAIGSWLEGYGYTILDPCCGAGTALKTITLNMSGYGESFGIEIEEGRAEKAKEVLDAVIHEDLFNLGIEHRSFGAVFLNPPYYQSEALHQPFIEKATEVLAPEGILILIIPDYEVCGKTSSFLSSFYDIIKVFKAIDQRFSQVIIFGLKKKRPELQEGKDISLLAQGAKEIVRASRYDAKMEVPSTKPSEDIRISIKSIDPEKMGALLDSWQEDWKRLKALIPASSTARRPLLPLRRGHLAQLLASGLIDGVVVHPETKERYLIKGTTNRVEEVVEETEGETRIVSKDMVTILMMNTQGNVQKIT